MAFGYNHATQHLHVDQVNAMPLTMQALINAIREEEASERGICYSQIADASGKNDLGGGISTGITVALRDAWYLHFEPGAYQASVTGGNLADALARIQNSGSPNVVVLASAASTLVETGVSGLTAGESALLSGIANVPTATEVADAVWAKELP